MPVDLTNLRTITDGDKEMEELLFAQFRESGDATLQAMQDGCIDGPSEGWRKAAHAVKGTSYNLGAKPQYQISKCFLQRYAKNITKF